jgi:hypothetical protein
MQGSSRHRDTLHRFVVWSEDLPSPHFGRVPAHPPRRNRRVRTRYDVWRLPLWCHVIPIRPRPRLLPAPIQGAPRVGFDPKNLTQAHAVLTTSNLVVVTTAFTYHTSRPSATSPLSTNTSQDQPHHKWPQSRSPSRPRLPSPSTRSSSSSSSPARWVHGPCFLYNVAERPQSSLTLVTRLHQYTLGYKQTLKQLRSGKG